MRDSGSGRVTAVVVVFVLLLAGGIVGLRLYHRFTPHVLGGARTPATPLAADHVYNLPLRYTVADGRGRRIDAIRIPTIKGLDLTVTGVSCKAAVMKKLTEGPNLASQTFDPAETAHAYFAKITRKIYGDKLGTPANPAVCAVLTAHSHDPGTYHVGPLVLDWRAGLFVGRVRDQTDLTLTFS